MGRVLLLRRAAILLLGMVAVVAMSQCLAPPALPVTLDTGDTEGVISGEDLQLTFHTDKRDGQEGVTFAFVNPTDGSAASQSCDEDDGVDGGFWAHDAAANDCYVVHTFTRPLAEALQGCNFEGPSTLASGDVAFDTAVEITMTNATGSVFGTDVDRVTTSAIDVRVLFPSNIVVSTDVDVSGGPDVFEAFTTQEFDATTRIATLTLVTQVEEPFVLSSTGIAVTNGHAATLASGPDTTCDGPTPADCEQVWTFTVDPAAACTLDTVLTLDFGVDCQDAFTGACTQLADNTAQAAITITSDDFCPRVVEVVEVEATTLSYSDAAHTTASTNFVFGSTVYWQTEITVASGVQIDSVTVVSAEVESQCSPCTDPVVDITALASYAESQTAAGTDPFQHNFEFQLDAQTVKFDDDAATGIMSAVVTIEYDVTYRTAANQGGESVTARILRRTPYPAQRSGTTTARSSADFGAATPASGASSEATIFGVATTTFAFAVMGVVATALVASVGATLLTRSDSASLPPAAGQPKPSMAADIMRALPFGMGMGFHSGANHPVALATQSPESSSNDSRDDDDEEEDLPPGAVGSGPICDDDDEDDDDCSSEPDITAYADDIVVIQQSTFMDGPEM